MGVAFQKTSSKGVLMCTSINLEVVGGHGSSTETKDVKFCSEMDGKEASPVSVRITCFFWMNKKISCVTFQKKAVIESLMAMSIGLGVCRCHVRVMALS